jgi:Ca2+-dependent lipid-binding protein
MIATLLLRDVQTPVVKLSDSIRLSVVGLEAWDLPKTEMLGKDDPYIKLCIEGHEPRKTSTVSTTARPKSSICNVACVEEGSQSQ